MSFEQISKFAPGVLISTMFAAEKEEVKWVVWFS
jgi:hypothetical protein